MDDKNLDNLNEKLEKTITDTETILEETLNLDVEELKDQLELIVREHPIKSVLISFGVGYLLFKAIKIIGKGFKIPKTVSLLNERIN